MSVVKSSNKVWVVCKVNLNCECAVTIVGQQLVARLDIANLPVRIPPSSCNTNLRISSLDIQIESLGLNLVPYILWECVIASYFASSTSVNGIVFATVTYARTLVSIVLAIILT